MNDNLFEKVQTSSVLYEDVIKEMGSKLKESQQINSVEQYVEEVMDRETYGDIEIYPDVILPHIQSNNILKTGIYLIQGNNHYIDWHNQKIKLIILLNLKQNEEKSVQLKIQKFMRNLADTSYIEALIK
ncbi:PTS sugar transporter subunit IIA [Mammaliicoccus sp. Dog046]|uniref:PTS sugar transporter subunit IIA n=1 Tax=Mammaliicoccus sp. Dog046 TaxID=3034233 RepID=UPI002B2580AD|nr:PTS sugar transporter subunit IIA [Mammaliicoccus sp. Dog046]WQK85228.1 PTS sugar transporter subunit IIA [Mammaliicoccus sp. Dog046]